ncbi:MAG: AAA family ATPase [Ignavibacteria bacterium]|nr:MAG: AAA family ATPase [Ignavibacteria bacterium]
MDAFKVLFFDIAPQNRIAEQVRDLLQGTADLSYQIQLQVPNSSDLHEASLELSATLAALKPDLSFLLFESGQLEQLAPLFQLFQLLGIPGPAIAVINTYDPREVVRALDFGAADFLIPPIRPAELLPRLHHWTGRSGRQKLPGYDLENELWRKPIIGEDPAFLAELRSIPVIARADVSVLILGETGTGKEIVARTIHNLSSRSAGPFVALNCGAIPVELAENELFGHERGAFTSASSSAQGSVQSADGGILFLDEVDALPLLTQVKLLRFLQDKNFKALGSSKTLNANVRVITASNTNLHQEIRTGKFRQDLYYRINVSTVSLPPLNKRGNDVVLLARHFLSKFAVEFGKPVRDFSPCALQKLLFHTWPGNVRELENVIERAVLLTENVTIAPEDIQLPIFDSDAEFKSFRASKSAVVKSFEVEFLTKLLTASGGNITRSAQVAGMDRSAFRQLMRKHDISGHELPPS